MLKSPNILMQQCGPLKSGDVNSAGASRGRPAIITQALWRGTNRLHRINKEKGKEVYFCRFASDINNPIFKAHQSPSEKLEEQKNYQHSQ